MKTIHILLVSIIFITIIWGCKKTKKDSVQPTPIIPAKVLPTKSDVIFESDHDAAVQISTDSGSTYHSINNVYHDNCFYVATQISGSISQLDRLYPNSQQTINYKVKFHWTSNGSTQVAQRTFKLVNDGNYHLVAQSIPDSGDMGAINFYVCSQYSSDLIVISVNN